MATILSYVPASILVYAAAPIVVVAFFTVVALAQGACQGIKGLFGEEELGVEVTTFDANGKPITTIE